MILAPWRLLADHEFALGCPLAATVVDAAENDLLRVHVRDLLARWQAAVADVYITVTRSISSRRTATARAHAPASARPSGRR
jgi:hypothetical protein